MALVLASLPQDILILIALHLLVEDLLALMQTCRTMHALGTLDYLWRRLLSDWDIPVDIPLKASIASLPSSILREAAVKYLKLDSEWRDPHRQIRHAQRVIPRNSSFVDKLRLLPGGRWLVTLQYEQASERTHVTLWSVGHPNGYHSVFSVILVGRSRFLHAHHHHELEQITIGIAYVRGYAEYIRVYDIFLQGDFVAHHSLVFEAGPHQLGPLGRLAGMEINGKIMTAALNRQSTVPDDQGRVLCVNLVTRAAAILLCPDWSPIHLGHNKLFSRHFAVEISPQFDPHSTALIFYELPPVILDRSGCLSSLVSCWPEAQVIVTSPVASTLWSSEHLRFFAISDGASTGDTGACCFTIVGHPILPSGTGSESLGIDVLRVSFDGCNIGYTHSVVPCRPVVSPGDVRVSPSGKRAVWLTTDSLDPDFSLVKCALDGRVGKQSGPCISTLMPSFSGLPFKPGNIHSYVFDEISCKIATGLTSGELYISHM